MKDYKNRSGSSGGKPSKPSRRRKRSGRQQREFPARESPGFQSGRPARPSVLSLFHPAVKWLRTHGAVLIWGACALWLAAGLVSGSVLLWRSPLQVVRLEGNSKLEASEVLAWGRLSAGMPMHQVDPYTIARRLSAHPLVHRADLRRIYPGVAVIRIGEREPELRLLLADGRTAVLDRENVILAVYLPGQPLAGIQATLPQARGISVSPETGSRVDHPALPRVRELFATLADLGFSGAEGTQVHLLSPSRLAVQFPKGHRLFLPPGKERSALRLYHHLVSRQPELLQNKSGIDFGAMGDEFGGRIMLLAAKGRK